MSQLVTGEAVTLHLRPARLGSRLLARGLDVGIELVAFTMLGQLIGVVALGDSSIAGALLIANVVLFMVGYPLLFEALWRGQTPGKAALGLRVVRDDGGPIRFRHALARALIGIVELWLTFGSVALLVSLVSSRGKRLGDVVAGTFVVRERVPRQHVVPVLMPPALATWAMSLDLSRLPDDLALAVRSFLGRASQLTPEARERLGSELGAAVSACVTPPPPPGTPGWAFLAAVVAERRRREEARLPAPVPGWGPAAPSPGWGGSPPGPSPWPASAPPTGAPPSTGAPPPVGPPPPQGAPPRDPGPPRVPAPPSPQWGPAPVPASPPPPSPGSRPARGPAPAPEPDRTPEPAPPGGFALPG